MGPKCSAHGAFPIRKGGAPSGGRAHLSVKSAKNWDSVERPAHSSSSFVALAGAVILAYSEELGLDAHMFFPNMVIFHMSHIRECVLKQCNLESEKWLGLHISKIEGIHQRNTLIIFRQLSFKICTYIVSANQLKH